MTFAATIARALRVPLDLLENSRLPQSIKIGGVVLAVAALATVQVVYGARKGATLSQEKPDIIAYGRGPRNLAEEKALLGEKKA